MAIRRSGALWRTSPPIGAGEERPAQPIASSQMRRAFSASSASLIRRASPAALASSSSRSSFSIAEVSCDREPLGPGLGLGVRAPPVVLLERGDVLLHPAEPVLDRRGSGRAARGPAASQRRWIDGERLRADWRRSPASSGSASSSSASFALRLSPYSASCSAWHGGLRRVDRVARGAEPRPQGVVDALAGAAGALPLVEQGPVLADRVAAEEPARASARATMRSFSSRRGALRRVELGEVRAALRVDVRAGVAEPLPQVVRLALRQAGAGALRVLPAGEEGVDGLARSPSTARSRGRGRRAPPSPRRSRRGRCGPARPRPCAPRTAGRSGPRRCRRARRRGRAAPARSPTADGVSSASDEPAHRLRDVRGRGAAAGALLEQGHLARRGPCTCARSRRSPRRASASGYSLPPSENRLPIAVEAGEQIPYERAAGV